MRRRVRAYGGLWALVAVLALVASAIAATAGPVAQRVADQALRGNVENATPNERDIAAYELGEERNGGTATGMLDDLEFWLPPELDAVVAEGWGASRTRILLPSTARPNQYVTLAGPGVSTEPDGFLPLATLYHQTGLTAEGADPAITMRDGGMPANERGAASIEVMVAEEMAASLGLVVGETYHLLLGEVVVAPSDVDPAVDLSLPVRVAGVFAAVDPEAPVWSVDSRVLAPVPRCWQLPGDDVCTPLQQGALVTDEVGIAALGLLNLDQYFGVEHLARYRLDAGALDAEWADGAEEAVAALQSDPRVRETVRIETGLADLVAAYRREAAAGGAVAAVFAAGAVGTVVGLVLLAARLTATRRRTEVALVRARGASTAVVTGRLAGEAALTVLPAVLVGWLVHLPLAGGVSAGAVVTLAAMAVLGVLAVPAAVEVDRRSGSRPREDVQRHRAAPVRLTVEALVVVLAAVGVLLLHQRGVPETGVRVGTDPYLSAVPVLVALAAGLLALRLYPLPLRLVGGVLGRVRGAVGFLGTARAARAAPATALPVLVLVLAVAVGGFAAGVYSSVVAARDQAAIRAEGADVRAVAAGVDARVPGDEGFSEPAIAEVAALPGVTDVARVSRAWIRPRGGNAALNTTVVVVDAPAYQRVLAGMGTPGRLAPELLAAEPGAEPVPVMISPGVEVQGTLVLDVALRRMETRVVGELGDLPQLSSSRIWLVAPRAALPEPPVVEQLLIGGSQVDPAAVEEVLAGDAEEVLVTTREERREILEQSGFNRGLTIYLVAGMAVAAAGGLLAVGLALVVPAAARGQALSRLRTMGLSTGQARRLLIVELLPLTVLTVLVGAAAGLALPALLAPALGLTAFTGGAAVPVAVDLGMVGLLVGLVCVLVVGGAVAEAAANRRLGLGQVLRVD